MIYMASNDYYSDQAAQKFLKELNEVGPRNEKHSKSGRVKIVLCVLELEPASPERSILQPPL
jgi:hypothetical protein